MMSVNLEMMSLSESPSALTKYESVSEACRVTSVSFLLMNL